MKIDVEGAEMDVFRGAEKILSSSRPKIFLSTHSDELRSECLKFLEERGYSVEPLTPGGDEHQFLARPR